MKKTKFGNILENAARLAGRQVGVMGVPENWRALASLAVSEGIRRIAAEKFPVMQRIEYRRYRPTWSATATWEQGNECWHDNAYWRLEATSGASEPGVGTAWRKLRDDEVVAFVAFEQPWENTVIDRTSVDANRFAYAADPKLNPTATPLRATMNELGVVLQSPAPNGVWCKFVPRYPNVSFIEWSGSSSYGPEDVVYLSETKECYQCLGEIAAPAQGATNLSPRDDHEHWDAIRISSEFENYLTRLCAVDLLTEDQGKYQTKAAADREFDELCARFHEGNGESRVRTGRFM